MFGTLKLRACCGSEELREAHQRYYCGLCQAMGVGYGQPLRALHSYDGVFVALVADGLQRDGAAHATTVCPMLPVVRKASIDPRSPAMACSAAVQLLIGDQWLADRSVEGGLTASASRKLLSGRVARARERLSELGVDLSGLQGFERRQGAVEQLGAGPVGAAEPTAAALELVFDRLADLPGSEVGDRSVLADFGRHLGRAIYLLDALEDCGDDARQGAFNPCLVGGEVQPERVEAAATLLDEDLAALPGLCDRLPLARNRELVSELAGPSLARRARAAATAGRAAATGAARAERARYREMGVVQRLGWAAAALVVSVWTFVVGLPEAFASWVRPGAVAGHSASDCGNDCANKCGDQCCDNCGSSCPCSDCCDSCKGCGDSCQGCGDSCQGCCNNCPGTWMVVRR